MTEELSNLEEALNNTTLEDEDIKTEKKNKRMNKTQIFGSIVDFVCSLRDNYGDQFYELKLYSLLLENTGLIHEEQVEKHINIIENYLLLNREFLSGKEVDSLKGEIKFSEKVFIDLKAILQLACTENREIIWEHIYSLFALIFPDDPYLNKIISTTVSKSIKEDNLFQNMFEVIQKSIPQDANMTDGDNINPMKMMSTLLEGDFMKNMMNTISSSFAPDANGDNNNSQAPDFNNMLHSLTGMVGEISKQIEQKKG